MVTQSIDKLQRMVEQQIRARGIDEPRILQAFLNVPREKFVPKSLVRDAYDDAALPIGQGQTISQPFTVAFMLQALHLAGNEKVLEVGTGSGYAAALLSQIAREVHTVERIPELAKQAKQRLDEMGLKNVHIHLNDGSLGLPEFAPYDAIIVAAGAEQLPQPLQDQLCEGGRILIPIGNSKRQSMMRFTKVDGKLISENLGGFAFVPLVGEFGW